MPIFNRVEVCYVDAVLRRIQGLTSLGFSCRTVFIRIQGFGYLPQVTMSVSINFFSSRLLYLVCCIGPIAHYYMSFMLLVTPFVDHGRFVIFNIFISKSSVLTSELSIHYTLSNIVLHTILSNLSAWCKPGLLTSLKVLDLNKLLGFFNISYSIMLFDLVIIVCLCVRIPILS